MRRAAGMVTYGDWFSGGGGMTLGAVDAGATVVFGLEYESEIADVYRENLGDHVCVGDVLDVSVEEFPYVDIFHASPPCPSFSVAKTNGIETKRDRDMAARVGEYIQLRQPKIVTLENVWGWRQSKSWESIHRVLVSCGYELGAWKVNMADYGVPQTRERMIVVARRDGFRPSIPLPTHTKISAAALGVLPIFADMVLPRWVGWYEAIADIVHTLPESKFAPWQIDRLLQSGIGSFLVDGQTNNGGEAITIRGHGEHRLIVAASADRRKVRAFVAPVQGLHSTHFPGDEPIQTISAAHDSQEYRGMLMSGGNASGTGKRPWAGDEPCFTLTASIAIKESLPTGHVGDGIVSMTVRALARFQSFPDSYRFPTSKKYRRKTGELFALFPDEGGRLNNRLSCKIIGNSVPPRFAAALYRHLTLGIA